MSLLERIVIAHRCRSTHHYIAMDALPLLSGPDAEKWRNLILVHNEELLKGAKAPDAVFKDFKNHVLHVGEGEWGGARDAAMAWYAEAVAHLQDKKWDKAIYALGVLSHYYADPIQPFHTGQTEEEGAMHRALEWSVAKSRTVIKERIDELGYPDVPAGDGAGFVSDMVRAGAEKSHPHYQTLIDHYNLDVGVANPPAGLDQTLIDIFAELVAYATAGLSVLFSRAFAEAGVAAPNVNITVPGYLSTLDIPIHWVAKKLDNGADKRIVTAMYKEYKKTGKVVKTLPDDDKAIRKAHARQVLRRPLKEIDAQPLRPLGKSYEPRPEYAEFANKVAASLAPQAADEPVAEADSDTIVEVDIPEVVPVVAKPKAVKKAKPEKKAKPVKASKKKRVIRVAADVKESDQAEPVAENTDADVAAAKAAEAERLAKEEADRLAKEEAERLAKERADAAEAEEFARLEAEEEARIVAEAEAEQKAKEKAQEALRVASQERARQAEEKKARLEAEEMARIEAEEAEEARRLEAERKEIARFEAREAAEFERLKAEEEAELARMEAEEAARIAEEEAELARMEAEEAKQIAAEQAERAEVEEAIAESEDEFTLEELAAFDTNLTENGDAPQEQAPPVDSFFEASQNQAGSNRARSSLMREDPVIDAPSIGKKTARRLNRVGIFTVEDLLTCDSEEIAFELDVRHIDEATLEDWKAQAVLMIEVPGLRVHDAQILVGAGIRNGVDLANASATKIFHASMGFLKTSEGARIVRDDHVLRETEVDEWIGLAKDSEAA